MASAKKKSNGAWTEEEDQLLAYWNSIVGNKWSEVATHIPGKTGQQCAQRWRHRVNPAISREKWTEEEDRQLADLVAKHGSSWAEIARRLPGRTDQQCMGRWRRHLDPSINRSTWEEQEDDILRELVAEYGTSWSCISKSLEGRTAQQCRARWCQLSNAENSRSRSGKSKRSSSTSAAAMGASGGSSAAAAGGSRAAGRAAATAVPAAAAAVEAATVKADDGSINPRRESTANTSAIGQATALAVAAAAGGAGAAALGLAEIRPEEHEIGATGSAGGAQAVYPQAPRVMRSQQRRRRPSVVSEVGTNAAAVSAAQACAGGLAGGSAAWGPEHMAAGSGLAAMDAADFSRRASTARTATGAAAAAMDAAAAAAAAFEAEPKAAGLQTAAKQQEQQGQELGDEESPALTINAASQLAFLSPSRSGALPQPPLPPHTILSGAAAVAGYGLAGQSPLFATPGSAGRKRAAAGQTARMAAFSPSLQPLALPAEGLPPPPKGTAAALTPQRNTPGSGPSSGQFPSAGLLSPSPNLLTLLQSPQGPGASGDPFKSPGFGSMITPPWARDNPAALSEAEAAERRQSVARRLDSAPSFASLAAAGIEPSAAAAAAVAGLLPAASIGSAAVSFDFGIVGSPPKKARTASSGGGADTAALAAAAAAAAASAAVLATPWLGAAGLPAAAATPWVVATGTHLLQPESAGRSALALAVEHTLQLASAGPAAAALAQQQRPGQQQQQGTLTAGKALQRKAGAALGGGSPPESSTQLTSSNVRVQLHTLLQDTA